MFEISVRASFSSAHQLRGYKGKCENLHGHNWKVEAFIQAKGLNKQGMLLDFTDFKAALHNILMEFDHKLLNDIPYFKKVNPTSENVAKCIYEKLNKQLSAVSCQLSTVSVWETDASCATYFK